MATIAAMRQQDGMEHMAVSSLKVVCTEGEHGDALTLFLQRDAHPSCR